MIDESGRTNATITRLSLYNSSVINRRLVRRKSLSCSFAMLFSSDSQRSALLMHCNTHRISLVILEMINFRKRHLIAFDFFILVTCPGLCHIFCHLRCAMKFSKPRKNRLSTVSPTDVIVLVSSIWTYQDIPPRWCTT